MIQQTPKSIYIFKKGDVITRLKPSKPVMKMGDEELVNRDHIGTPFHFVGIANGCIYLKPFIPKQDKEIVSFLSIIGAGNFAEKVINLELDLFEEGWDYYIDPTTLEDVNYSENVDLDELEDKKQKAIRSQNYEEAKKIQKKIDELKK